MNLLDWSALVIVLVAVAVIAILGQFPKVEKRRPCYRCGGMAEVEYMGLHYCRMCRTVVVAMISSVQHDPPYGFPGAGGYLEFPEKEEE